MDYKTIKYPDGQISVEITDFDGPIKKRINSYEDLIGIVSAGEVLRHQGKSCDLFIPCLLGQRSDRRFGQDQSFDLKVIAGLINSGGFGNVSILDPHSDVALALIDRSTKVSSYQYVAQAYAEEGSPTLVSPDAGAYKKVFEYGQKLGAPVVAAVKHRDKDGKIDLSFIGDVAGQKCLIVDDLADGGYTFVLLAEALRRQGAIRVALYVTHAYFNKGFGLLAPLIDNIYCTNSVKDIVDPLVTQYNVI